MSNKYETASHVTAPAAGRQGNGSNEYDSQLKGTQFESLPLTHRYVCRLYPNNPHLFPLFAVTCDVLFDAIKHQHLLSVVK
jgi:hypothetical protein